MISLTHRSRHFLLIFIICFLVYLTLDRIGSSNDDNRKSLFSKSKIYVFNNNNNHPIQKSFKFKLPKIQYDFDIETDEQVNNLLEKRRQAVKSSFMHGWNGYKTYALGSDELKPLTNTGYNPFGGLSATLIDSLSTMLIMDMKDEVGELIPMVEKMQFKVDEHLSVFETIIRLMGGLLSAYELSDDPRKYVFLKKAEEIGLMLLPAFESNTGLPPFKYNPLTGESRTNFTFLADIGTIQLEFYTLSFHTGNLIFAEKAQAITDFMDSANTTIPGLYPYDVNNIRGGFKNAITSFGAMGDSAYEYFLKQYLMTDGHAPQFSRMYLRSIDSMKSHMLLQHEGSKLLFLPSYDTRFKKSQSQMDHLVCFVPGMLAMGSKIFNRPDDMVVAKGLLETCVHMYRSSRTHLAPESWGTAKVLTHYDPFSYGRPKRTSQNRWQIANDIVENKRNRTLPNIEETPSGVTAHDTRYLLRPETIESLYIMYRITGDPIYQEYGWLIYEALETHCKTESAYAVLKDVNKPALEIPIFNQIDSMETFLFAETFKYLYLLFSSPQVISLDEYVLNTEAHPLLRRPWTLKK